MCLLEGAEELCGVHLRRQRTLHGAQELSSIECRLSESEPRLEGLVLDTGCHWDPDIAARRIEPYHPPTCSTLKFEPTVV